MKEYRERLKEDYITPEQQVDFEDAWVLAIEANKYFDKRRQVASTAANIIERNKPTDAADRISSDSKAFMGHDSSFEHFQRLANVLMPPRAAFETVEPAEPFASEAVWVLMSKEQKVKADNLRTAMAERFAEYGVTADSLRVVMHKSEEGKNVFTLIHTGNGVDIGDSAKDYDNARCYNSVMSKENDDLLTIVIDGKKYDTRKGMTDSAYDALYEDSKSQGITLPDSKQMSEITGDLWTWTMLTGEPLTADGRGQVCDVVDGVVRQSVTDPYADYRFLRVRLAVVIE